jgi:putative SOS response-associated peptidase YedK
VEALTGAERQHHFRLKCSKVFAFAGLWDYWGELETSALVTANANDLVKEVHPRMPVILGPKNFGLWLDGEADREDLLGLLRPFPAELLEGFAVSPRVNRGGGEGADLIEPLRA